MHMIDAIREPTQELHRIDTLPVQMARIEREPEVLAAVEHVQNDFRGIEVERELPRVNLAREPYPALAGRVEDRVPLLRELTQGVGDHVLPRRGVTRDVTPDRRPGE